MGRRRTTKAGVDRDPERRRYYPDEDTVPLSKAIAEAIDAHDQASAIKDEFEFYENVNPEAIDMLFAHATDSEVEISVQFHLADLTVSVWSEGGTDIRVSEKLA